MDTLVALFSIAAGALLGGVARSIFDRYAIYVDSRGVATAIAAEVKALLLLMEQRGIPTQLAAIAARLADPAHVVVAADVLSMRTTQDYFVVFRALTAKIGLLGERSPAVIFFYSLARAIVEDAGGLREQRDQIASGKLVAERETVLGWHRDFEALLSATLADGHRLLGELDAFRKRRWLGIFR